MQVEPIQKDVHRQHIQPHLRLVTASEATRERICLTALLREVLEDAKVGKPV
jgi:hypothetical protein